MDKNDELLLAFIEESTENLDKLDLDLVKLETNFEPDLLADVFRTFHTIKGTCGFLGLNNLEQLAHAGESLLGKARENKSVLDSEAISALLKLADSVRATLVYLEQNGEEPDDGFSELTAELKALTDGTSDGSKPEEEKNPEDIKDVADQTITQSPSLRSVPDEKQLLESENHILTKLEPAEKSNAGEVEEKYLRVELVTLDLLQELVGELTLARMRVGSFIEEDSPVAGPFHQMTLITKNLQKSVSLARLQPMTAVLDRCRRIARDLALEEGKEVVLKIEGETIRVDRSVNEILRDPLIHLVRNAIDHGIETPEERLAAGKDPIGTVKIEAKLLGGGVNIELTDDGKGVDYNTLASKAIAEGLLSETQAANLDQEGYSKLLFLRGLSSKSQVTTISGRGVGMDVVKTNLEKVGGKIHVQSVQGEGTTFKISLPLTLAVIQGLVVGCQDSKYVIPQLDVLTIVQTNKSKLEQIGEAYFIRWEGTLLQLVSLAEKLGGRPEDLAVKDQITIVIIQKDNLNYGLIVDGMEDNLEAVVKPLPEILGGGAFIGTTILPDGCPYLIVDVLSNQIAPAKLTEVQKDTSSEEKSTTGFLLVSSGKNRYVLPLSRVRRLERLEVKNLKRSAKKYVTPYNKGILELTPIGESEILNSYKQETHVDAVVCSTSSGIAGLLVDSIQDILYLENLSKRGNQVLINSQIVTLVDVDDLTKRANDDR